MKRSSWIRTLLLMLIASALTFVLTVYFEQERYNSQLDQEREFRTKYAKLIEVSEHVERSFIGEIDDEKVMDGIIAGYIYSLGDQWSGYMSASSYAEYTESMSGEFGGIGVSAAYDEESGGILVLEAYDDSPAAQAGVNKGDIIVSVGGEAIAEIGYETAVGRIRGPEGSMVSITLQRPNGSLEDVTIMRATIKKQSVSSRIIDGDIGVIRISEFDLTTDADFIVEVEKLRSANVKGIIFDVRYNPGGSKDAMINMLDHLLPEGTLFIERDKAGNQKEESSDENCVELPMAVLVNEHSYSAAEFFAAALREYEWAFVVGEKTTGKGYAQTDIPLQDGSAIHLSIVEYFTPKGVSLAEAGLTPDITVSLPEDVTGISVEDDRDTQLAAALRGLREIIASTEKDPLDIDIVTPDILPSQTEPAA